MNGLTGQSLGDLITDGCPPTPAQALTFTVYTNHPGPGGPVPGHHQYTASLRGDKALSVTGLIDEKRD